MEISNKYELSCPILSVTIATFNVESYISECLESILNQTFKDFELICVDDGSVDNTVQIIRKYAKKDKRIRLINNPKNQGLAVIRNQSLKEAKGKYVFFLDGDDLYDSTYFEKSVNLAENEQSDIIISDYLPFYNKNEIVKQQGTVSALHNIDVNNKVLLLQRPAFACVKLIKTKVAKDLGIVFPPGFTRQDIPVHWHLITSIDKISLLPEKLTFYRQQPEATTAKKDKKLFHLAYVMDIVKQYLSDNKIYDKYKNEFLRQQLNLLFGMYDSVKEEYKSEALSIIKERLTDDHYSFIKQNNAIRKQAKYFYLSLTGNPLFKIKYQVWLTVRAIYRKIKS